MVYEDSHLTRRLVTESPAGVVGSTLQEIDFDGLSRPTFATDDIADGHTSMR